MARSISLTVSMDPVQMDALHRHLVSQVETIKTERNTYLTALAEAAQAVFLGTTLFNFTDELPPSERDAVADLYESILSWLIYTGEVLPDPADDPSNAVSGK